MPNRLLTPFPEGLFLPSSASPSHSNNSCSCGHALSHSHQLQGDDLKNNHLSLQAKTSSPAPLCPALMRSFPRSRLAPGPCVLLPHCPILLSPPLLSFYPALPDFGTDENFLSSFLPLPLTQLCHPSSQVLRTL